MKKRVFLIILLILSTISIQIAYSNDRLLIKEAIKNPFSFILSLININSISGNTINEITGNVPFDPAITIFVDNSLSVDCIGQYNPDNAIGNRCDGSDVFDAYNTLQEAANVVIPGDEVLVRGGTYLANFQILGSGTATDRITFKNYLNEEPILDQQYTRGHCVAIGQGDIVNGFGHYVTLDGFTCKNVKVTGIARAIRAFGTRGVIIKNNHVYQEGFSDLITDQTLLMPGI